MRREFRPGEAASGKRLDQALRDALPDLSRASLQKAIRAGYCLIDGEKETDPSRKIPCGAHILLDLPETRSRLEPDEGDLRIIWRDAGLAVCVKPAGVTAHPCPSCKEPTFVERLLAHFPELAAMEGERPGIAHRLDKDTSGIMLAALNEPMRLALSRMFANREIHKEYLALVAGVPPVTGECSGPIGRHPKIKTRMAILPEKHGGRPARTDWRLLWGNGRIALLAVRIHSGRTHQIRVHLANAGYPILGDRLYAPKAVAQMAPRQMLHAWRLGFRHPESGELLDFQEEPPEDFRNVLFSLGAAMGRLALTGSQGSGKSTVRGYLEARGMPAVSADDLVASYYGAGGPAGQWLSRHFPDFALDRDGSVDKKALFALFQEDAALKEAFTRHIHDLVFKDIENFWLEAAKKGEKAALAEIPLYFECGCQNIFRPRPFVIGTHCPAEKRWQRIMASRGWSLEKVRTIEEWQLPEDEKMAACDIVLDNSGGEEDLAAGLESLLAELRRWRGRREAEFREKMKKIIGAHAASGRLASEYPPA